MKVFGPGPTWSIKYGRVHQSPDYEEKRYLWKVSKFLNHLRIFFQFNIILSSLI